MIEIWKHENHPQIAYFFVRPLGAVADKMRPILFAMGKREGVFACSMQSALEVESFSRDGCGLGWERVATVTNEQLADNINSIVDICTQSNNT